MTWVHNVAVRLNPALFVCACLLVAGCEDDPEPEPTGPTPANVGGALDATVESLISGPSLFGAGLSDYSFLYGTAEGLFHQLPGEPEAIALGDEAGHPLSVAELSDGSLLVVGTEGLFSISGEELTASPLQGALAELGISQLLSSAGEEGDDLWLMADGGTHLWSEGSLYTISPEGLELPASHFAWGSPVDGKDALWLASGETLYSLRFDDGLVAVQAHREETDVSAIAVDGYATVWLAADSSLWRRWPDERWDWFETPFTPTRMAAVEGSADLWIETEGGLWNQSADVFRPVDGTEGATLLGVDGAGRAIATTGEGLIRVAAGRPLLFVGLDDGSELTLPTAVRLLPTAAGSVVSVVASLNGEPLELDESLSVVFDPLELSDGAQELTATVTYDDEEEVVGSLFFSVGEFVAPTWADDILPLFNDHCALCHLGGQQATTAGGGHPIDSPAAWETEIEIILDEVQTERMPLNNPPLSLAEIQLIKSWRAGGFLE